MPEPRPNFIALPQNNAFEGTGTPSESPGLPSPRTQHVAGELAPAMSPLDRFAAQSRALAKQLEEQQKGNRGSRLPPSAVQETLTRQPQIFHSPPRERAQPNGDRMLHKESPVPSSYGHFEVEEPGFRPQSFYPRLSGIESVPDLPRFLHSRQGSQVQDEPPRTAFKVPESPLRQAEPSDYFSDLPRAPSPESIHQLRPSIESVSRSKKSFDSLSRRSNKSDLDRGMSIASTSSQVSASQALRPPNAPWARKTPSIRSVDSEDDNSGITPSTSWGEYRQISSSSNFSAPQSPANLGDPTRSPSLQSESSQHGHRHNKPSYNFSRPMSRDSRPSMDMPSRMSSTDSHPRFPEDSFQSMEGSGVLTSGEEQSYDERPTTPGGSTYVYSKWSLPRGRMTRMSDQPVGIPQNMSASQAQADLQALPTPPRSLDLDRPTRSSIDLVPPRPPPIPASELQHRRSFTSMRTKDSGSTIKAPHYNKEAAEMTAEDHLAKGIACHEKGSVNESTYHFRLAAKQNNPTGMLMYALACRHGWGMRANPAEGVNWLRKAMDCAHIELAHADEEEAEPKDVQGIKTRKAQFALSVYELGQSHMNGWGIVQDKTLALRCFETASSWGDADAMSEAGFCYAQGIGCKKDLKKAAKYYRDAEAKGVSMVGNSWIYKSKYDSDDKPSKKSMDKSRDADDRHGRSANKSAEKEKKPRDKSRTRSLFSRKKAG